jgi:septal ring factor EnvC (AmiA/AmiB activator)
VVWPNPKQQPCMLTHLRKYAPLILAVLLIGFYLFSQNRQDKEFKRKIEEIEKVRLTLEQKVKDLDAKTNERDKKLREAFKQNLAIIDKLNSDINKNKTSFVEIDKRIQSTEDSIDNLLRKRSIN